LENDGSANAPKQFNPGESVRFVTALHAMQTQSSDENSVCPSVCLSVRYTRGL